MLLLLLMMMSRVVFVGREVGRYTIQHGLTRNSTGDLVEVVGS